MNISDVFPSHHRVIEFKLMNNSVFGKIIENINRRAQSRHKKTYGYNLSRDVFRYHHKRQNYTALRDELEEVAWHPDRWWDWCVDEEEKQVAEKLWS